MKPQLTRRRFIHTAAAGSVAMAAIGAVQKPPLLADGTATREGAFTLATMPRVDVHTHIGNTWTVLDEVMELRTALRQRLDVDLAMWVGLGRAEPPDIPEMHRRYEGRIQFCVSDFEIQHGHPFRFSPEDLAGWHRRGVVGFKLYPGWQPGIQIDRAENDPIFSKMEEIGMVAASPHVTNPCGTFGRRTEWFSDPVEFWRQQRAWENVLKRHPKLTVVNAHLLWLCYSDEQLDCLRYMLETYPNLNVDLATTPVFLHAVGRDNLRDFMIQYADRILFGTDMASKWFSPVLDKQFPSIRDKVPQYQRYFTFLETDKEVPSGIEDERKMQGLALPLEVLEKIYFRNAMRIYPHIGAALTQLGYFGEAGRKQAAHAGTTFHRT